MTYSNNYSIISINYKENKRTTTARIVCEDTGEIFEGRAHRHPEDEMDIALATNLAVARAVKKMLLTNLRDDENMIIGLGDCLSFRF